MNNLEIRLKRPDGTDVKFNQNTTLMWTDFGLTRQAKNGQAVLDVTLYQGAITVRAMCEDVRADGSEISQGATFTLRPHFNNPKTVNLTVDGQDCQLQAGYV